MSRTGLWLLLAMLPLHAAQSAVYRWVDGNGQVHFSQTPPPTGSFELIQPRRIGSPPSEPPAAEQATAESPEGAGAASAGTPTPAPPTAVEINARFLEQAEAENKAKAEAKAKADQARAEATRKCETARARMQVLQDLPARRLATVAEDGNLRRLDDDAFDKRVAAAQKDVESHCR